MNTLMKIWVCASCCWDCLSGLQWTNGCLNINDILSYVLRKENMWDIFTDWLWRLAMKTGCIALQKFLLTFCQDREYNFAQDLLLLMFFVFLHKKVGVFGSNFLRFVSRRPMGHTSVLFLIFWQCLKKKNEAFFRELGLLKYVTCFCGNQL